MRQWSVSWGLVASIHTQTCLPLPLHLPLVSGSLSWGGLGWGIVKVKVTPSCSTLCNPMDYIVYGILQARILVWVAIPFSRGSSRSRDWTQVFRVASGFFTSWATREAQISKEVSKEVLFKFDSERTSEFKGKWEKIQLKEGKRKLCMWRFRSKWVLNV